MLAVHPQDLLDQVVVHGVSAANAQHLVGIQRTVGQLVAGLDHVAVLHQQAGVRHRVGAGVPVRCGDDDVHQAALAGLFELDRAADLCQSSHPLGLTGLKQFLDTGKALGDVAAGQTAGVEGTHGQLGAGFADGLGGNDADRLARTHRLLGGQVHAVALGAHAAVGLAGQHGADHDGGVLVNRRVEGAAVAVAVVGLDPLVGLQDLGVVLVHHLGAGQQHLAGIGVHHIAHQETAPEPVGELLDHLAVLADLGDLDAVGHVAVLLPDDDILGDVHHAAGQVTGVCGTQSRVGQALPGASGGDE
ncbi:Arginine-binding extracellular protein ArtP, partial [Dysosmobacter welbionis]